MGRWERVYRSWNMTSQPPTPLHLHSTPPSIAFCPSAPEATSFQRLWATSKGRNDRVKEQRVPSPGAQRAVGLGRREEAESLLQRMWAETSSQRLSQEGGQSRPFLLLSFLLQRCWDPSDRECVAARSLWGEDRSKAFSLRDPCLLSPPCSRGQATSSSP